MSTHTKEIDQRTNRRWALVATIMTSRVTFLIGLVIFLPLAVINLTALFLERQFAAVIYSLITMITNNKDDSGSSV